ncbi:hypothetical protein RE0346_08710 [Prescottella equi]|nr:hypothetical protein RE0346_08710 [Prescottella equi]
MDPNALERHRNSPYFDATEHCCGSWDRVSFEPDYQTMALDSFVPLLRGVFSRPATGTRLVGGWNQFHSMVSHFSPEVDPVVTVSSFARGCVRPGQRQRQTEELAVEASNPALSQEVRPPMCNADERQQS